MKKYILIMAGLVAAVSCARSGEGVNEPVKGVDFIIRDFVLTGSTRSSVAVDGTTVSCTWADGDKIGVFPNSASTLQPQQVRVKVTDGNSAAGASFTGNMIGWKLEQGIKYAAYYPFQNNYHLKSDNIVFSYDGQTQTGNDDKAHLGAFDYLYSAPVKSDAEGRATFTMSHAGALMLFRQWTDSELTLTKMVVTADGADIPESLKLNLFSGQPVSSQSTAKEFTVLLEDFTVPAKSFIRVWAMVPPVDLSEKTISVKFYNEESVITSYSVESQNFIAGNAYTVANPVYALIYDAGDGTFSGGGNKYTDVKYESSGSCTFTLLTGDATPAKENYTFRGWAEEQDGEVLEGDEITLTRTESKDVTKTLYAVYGPVKYTLIYNANGGKFADGKDTVNRVQFKYAEECEFDLTDVTAPKSDKDFKGWAENADGTNPVSGTTFTLTRGQEQTGDVEKNIYAVYESSTPPTPQADGLLPGVFSVSATKKVKFSQGNLQYHCKENKWRFAPNQYDYIGADNANISSSYDGWIDLFGWGTSGDNTYARTCYKPISTNTTSKNYYVKNGTDILPLSRENMMDWGINMANGEWRVLSSTEWTYLLTSTNDKRKNAFHISKEVVIDNIYSGKGLFIFPNDWDSEFNSPSKELKMSKFEEYLDHDRSSFYKNNSGEFFIYNNNDGTSQPNTKIYMTEDRFMELQKDGVLFLPVTGKRNASTISDLTGSNSTGYYWSSDNNNNASKTFCLEFKNNLNSASTSYYQYGCAVRLVTDVPSN